MISSVAEVSLNLVHSNFPCGQTRGDLLAGEMSHWGWVGGQGGAEVSLVFVVVVGAKRTVVAIAIKYMRRARGGEVTGWLL